MKKYFPYFILGGVALWALWPKVSRAVTTALPGLTSEKEKQLQKFFTLLSWWFSHDNGVLTHWALWVRWAQPPGSVDGFPGVVTNQYQGGAEKYILDYIDRHIQNNPEWAIDFSLFDRKLALQKFLEEAGLWTKMAPNAARPSEFNTHSLWASIGTFVKGIISAVTKAISKVLDPAKIIQIAKTV